MPRKTSAEHANHERWLVSYADFITLLFAFFVVMFATSQTDRSKARQVSESVQKAFSQNQIKAMVDTILGGTVDDKGQGNAMMHGPGGTKTTGASKPAPPAAELLPSLQILTKQLAPEIESGKISLSMQARGLVISFRQAALFPSGQTEITPRSFDSVGKVAEAILRIPNPVRLEGHTDSVPIHNARFRSNWDLSAARSIALLQLLVGRFNVSDSRLSIGGYADNDPAADNSTEEGRARNRRVDIVILNSNGMRDEPQRAEAPAAPAAAAPAEATPAAPAESAPAPPLPLPAGAAAGQR